MVELIELLHEGLLNCCRLLAVLIEIWGTLLLVVIVYREIVSAIKGRLNFKEMSRDMQLNHGLGTVLEVYLVAEVLKSVYSVDLMNLLMVALLVLVRVFIAFTLHWEGKQKEKELMHETAHEIKD